jgi:hypothetical protein
LFTVEVIRYVTNRLWALYGLNVPISLRYGGVWRKDL